jgi:hypothetical protein
VNRTRPLEDSPTVSRQKWIPGEKETRAEFVSLFVS